MTKINANQINAKVFFDVISAFANQKETRSKKSKHRPTQPVQKTEQRNNLQATMAQRGGNANAAGGGGNNAAGGGGGQGGMNEHVEFTVKVRPRRYSFVGKEARSASRVWKAKFGCWS